MKINRHKIKGMLASWNFLTVVLCCFLLYQVIQFSRSDGPIASNTRVLEEIRVNQKAVEENNVRLSDLQVEVAKLQNNICILQKQIQKLGAEPEIPFSPACK